MKSSLSIRQLQSQVFTLVEITMAIAIIGIGMAGVMALLPVGFYASRDSIADNYSSDMSEQFLHVIAQQCLMYEGVNGATADGWKDFILDTGSSKYIPTSKPTPVQTAPNYSNMVFGDTAADTDSYDDMGLYSSSPAGVYYSEARAGDILDFKGEIALWQEQVICDTNNDGDGTDSGEYEIPYKNATRLCLEISWPFDKPYDQREKRYYVYELFNPVER